MKSIPSYLDRYPAKMVTTLADKIIDNYVTEDSVILDPFCGSGVILNAAQKKNSKVYGIDINPYAILLSSVKLNGFNYYNAKKILEKTIAACQKDDHTWNTNYANADYWFTPSTLNKLYRIRYNLKKNKANNSKEGLAILLSFALSLRLSSKADQRSPKPFISKIAIENRKGKHFDPYLIIADILEKLSFIYKDQSQSNAMLFCKNSLIKENYLINEETLSHIITSPPYINAQDYFRNSKLELFFLEGLLPYDVAEIKPLFIGSEIVAFDKQTQSHFDSVIAIEKKIEKNNKRLAIVVNKYFSQMNLVLENTYGLLRSKGNLILVCGDNIVAGQKIITWKILNDIATSKGYEIVDQFKDKIMKRSLPPNRLGHKSLMKDETITIFVKSK